MSLRVGCLTMDAHDGRGLGAFWAAALDWVVVSDTDDGVYLVPPSVAGVKDSAVPGLLLYPCSDPKTVKNRV